MSMSAFSAAKRLRDQINRHTGIKSRLAPLAISEAGLSCRIVPQKVVMESGTIRDRKGDGSMTVKLLVILEGRIDGERAMDNALSACEQLARFALLKDRLEDEAGTAMPGHSLQGKPMEDDAIFEDPGEEKAAWIKEEYRFEIKIP